MKRNLIILCLALSTLPTYLHAATGQDSQTSQLDTQAHNAQTASQIPAGTVLPVVLNSTLRSDKTQNGATITATVLQDVPLAMGQMLHKGTKVTGHVVEVTAQGRGSDESKISFQFDHVRLGELAVPITTTLRAVASFTAVSAATPALAFPDYAESEIQIGGDQIAYGTGGPVTVGSQVVGIYTSQGVLANASQHSVNQDSGAPNAGLLDSNGHAQAFWLFSVNASGTYGFGDLKIDHSGSTNPAGEATLASSGKAVKVGKGSAMLLRVDGRGPDEAQAHTNLSQGTGR